METSPRCCQIQPKSKHGFTKSCHIHGTHGIFADIGGSSISEMSPSIPRSAILVSLLFFFFLDSATTTNGLTPVLVKRVQMHMGTLVSITAEAPNEPVAQAAIEAGFREIR